MSLDYEFAPIDVSIMTHHKACAAGPEAMGLWLWGQAYARVHKTSGRLHRPAVLAAWGGRRNIMLAKRLEEAGLWTLRDDGDWDVHNFERKSGQPSKPSASPRTSADRMRRFRSKKLTSDASDAVTCDASRDASDTVTCDASDGRDVTCDASPSISISNSLSNSVTDSVVTGVGVQGEGVQAQPSEPPPSAVVTLPVSATADPADEPPEWWPGVIETIATGTGVDLPAREAWLRYAGHRASKGRGAARGDAVHWLSTVMVREAREGREKSASRSRASPLVQSMAGANFKLPEW